MSAYWPDHYEFITEVELDDEPYQFNLIGIWKDTQAGELKWATDTGCSRHSAWEGTGFRTLETITPSVWKTIKRTVKESRAGMAATDQFIKLVEKARKK